MNTLEAIHARRSIRKYKAGVSIPREDLKQILEAAMMAPSACNTRPWEFVVVENEEKKKQIMGIHPYASMLSTASLAIVVCGRPDLQEGICRDYWPEDCGAATQNLLLAATELGYGTCWCGCYPRLERAAALQEVLGVNSVPFCIVALGEADEAPAPRGFYDETRVAYLR